MPFKSITKNREYFRELMRKRRAKEKGITVIPVIPRNVNPHVIPKVKPNIVIPECKECYTLKEEINKLKNQLENLQQLLTKKPTEISIKKEPRKVIIKEHKTSNSTTKSVTNKVTMRFDKNLLSEIQSFLTKNPHSFPSFSHFFRGSLLAYQSGMKINDQQKFVASEKMSPRLNEELQNVYHSFPKGQKTLILNQILASFLTKQ